MGAWVQARARAHLFLLERLGQLLALRLEMLEILAVLDVLALKLGELFLCLAQVLANNLAAESTSRHTR